MRLLALLLCLFPVFARAGLVFDQPVLRFHRPPEARELKAVFRFINKGDAAVKISRLKSSCGCTTPTVAKRDFAPGERGELAVTFNFGERRGPQLKLITVTTDDDAEQQLQLQVWIEDALVTTPTLLWWRIGDAPTAKPIALTLAEGVEVKITGLETSSPAFTAKQTSPKEITVTPTQLTEKQAATLTIKTDYPPEAPRAYTVHLRVK
jgi:hypothetical protein